MGGIEEVRDRLEVVRQGYDHCLELNEDESAECLRDFSTQVVNYVQNLLPQIGEFVSIVIEMCKLIYSLCLYICLFLQQELLIAYALERLEDYFVCSTEEGTEGHRATFCALELASEGRHEFADFVAIVETVVEDIRDGFIACAETEDEQSAHCFVDLFQVIRERAAEYISNVLENRDDIIERSQGLLFSYVQCRLISDE